MQTAKLEELLMIVNDTPQTRLFELNHFEDEIQDDTGLIEAWNFLFDRIPIEIADSIIENSDIDERISNAVEAQTQFYQEPGLCFNSEKIDDGNVLPLTYGDVATLLAN